MIGLFAASAAAQEAASVPADHADAEWKNRKKPDYPDAAAALRYRDTVDCRVRLFIDDGGTLADIEYVACPTVFRATVLDAAQQSRWYPPRENGVPHATSFLLIYKFNPRPADQRPPMRWCPDVEHVSFDDYEHVDATELTVLQPPPTGREGDVDCDAILAVDAGGRPVHVSTSSYFGTQPGAIMSGWCEARFAPLEPPRAVWVERACALEHGGF
jgi:hypothetical protein